MTANTDWVGEEGSKLDCFFRYVEKTWVGEQNPRTKLRKKPMFPFKMWNKYAATLAEAHQTNNLCEGYNNGFYSSLPNRASEWTLMEKFQVEEASSKAKLHQAAMGTIAGDSTTAKALQRKDKVAMFKNLVENFHHLSIKAYMNSIVSFYDK